MYLPFNMHHSWLCSYFVRIGSLYMVDIWSVKVLSICESSIGVPQVCKIEGVLVKVWERRWTSWSFCKTKSHSMNYFHYVGKLGMCTEKFSLSLRTQVGDLKFKSPSHVWYFSSSPKKILQLREFLPLFKRGTGLFVGLGDILRTTSIHYRYFQYIARILDQLWGQQFHIYSNLKVWSKYWMDFYGTLVVLFMTFDWL